MLCTLGLILRKKYIGLEPFMHLLYIDKQDDLQCGQGESFIPQWMDQYNSTPHKCCFRKYSVAECKTSLSCPKPVFYDQLNVTLIILCTLHLRAFFYLALISYLVIFEPSSFNITSFCFHRFIYNSTIKVHSRVKLGIKSFSLEVKYFTANWEAFSCLKKKLDSCFPVLCTF